MMSTALFALPITLAFADFNRAQIVNDSVMGGLSQSRIERIDDGLRFYGVLSRENNGGFASVRFRLPGLVANLDQVRFTAKGDGRPYELRFRQRGDASWVNYRYRIETSSERWQQYDIKLSDFEPVWRGMGVRGAPALASERLFEVALYAVDKREGEFEIEIGLLEFK